MDIETVCASLPQQKASKSASEITCITRTALLHWAAGSADTEDKSRITPRPRELASPVKTSIRRNALCIMLLQTVGHVEVRKDTH